MRIIAGKFKGHHLVSFNADHIRPTTDRVKESLFNILMGQMEESQILDLFSGTGNLGLEAISRGAGHVTFVEMNSASIAIIKRNIEKLKIEKEKYSIVKADVLKFLKTYEGNPFSIIFIDPPFTEKMADQVMMTLAASQVFDKETVIAMESVKGEKLLEEYGALKLSDRRQFGDKSLVFFQTAPSVCA